MKQITIRSVLSLILVLSAAPILGACHTTAGAGEDISRTGDVFKKSADQHTP